jgi:branched-chain amino acid transport system substrate-binding protein
VTVTGQVKLYAVSPAGPEKVIEVVGPGSSFAEALMFTGRPYIINAQSLSDTLLLSGLPFALSLRLPDKSLMPVMNRFASIPAARIYSDNGIPQIAPSATAVAYTAQGYKTAFRVMANDAQQGKVLGEFASNRLGAKKIAVLDDRTAYGQGIADEFVKSAQASGAQIVAREYTTDKAVDFAAVLTSIKGKQPDLIFFGGMDPQGSPMVKQLRALGMKTQFMMGDGGYTPKFIDNAGGAAEGTYASLPGVPLDKMPSGRDFATRYEAQFKQPIQLYAPYCYDAVNVMIAAMQKADSAEPAKYLPLLGAVVHDGVTAKIAFDAKGDLKGGAVTLYQVRQAKWQAVETMGGAAP